MSYERPQNTNAPHTPSDGEEPPRYGVRLPEGQDTQGGASSGQQQTPAYQAVPGYNDANQNPYDQPYVAPPVTPGRGLAIASVVLGVISVLLFFLGLTFLLAVLGLVFAIIALVKARKVPGSRKGMSITGLVLNIIGLILGGIALIFWVFVGGAALQILQDPAGQECITQYTEDQNMEKYRQCIEQVAIDSF
ncbi:MAG: DUF4190 domain-containing protein [Kocuria sp.]|nr:DUF4190 domain-containing protein [Kocuria sp.]